MMFEYQPSGNVFLSNQPCPHKKVLDAGIYKLGYHPMRGYFFTPVTAMQGNPRKIYGNSVSRADRIVETFEKRPGISTGVLLSGTKGSGKTLVTRLVVEKAAAKGYPVILVEGSQGGPMFAEFTALVNNQVTQSAVWVIDEFEKQWEEKHQEQMLTLMDGVEGGHRLFMLTVNKTNKVNENMLDRPGRIFYHIQYDGMEWEIIMEMLRDRLEPEAANKAIMFMLYVSKPTVDMVNALVDELRRYPDSTTQDLETFLNITLDSKGTYRMTLIDPAGKSVGSYTGRINPFLGEDFRVYTTSEKYFPNSTSPSVFVDMGDGAEDYSALVGLDLANKRWIHQPRLLRYSKKKGKSDSVGVQIDGDAINQWKVWVEPTTPSSRIEPLACGVSVMEIRD